MPLIDNYININITRGKLGVNSSSLNTLLIIGDTKKAVAENTLPLVKSYGSLAEVAVDYTNTANPEYKAASSYFGQDVKPTKLLIGRVIGTQQTDTFAAAYPKITLANNDFYGVVITSKVEADQLAIAGLVEADNKIFGVSNENVIMLDGGDTNSLAYKTKNLNLLRTYVTYNGLASNTYPEAAWTGKMFSKDAGSATWAYKNLSGVVADKLTSANVTGLQTNNCNFYVSFGGVDSTFDGKTAVGEFIDIVQGSDWLTANMQAKIANAFLNADKIPMTNQGIGILENMVRASLNEASERNIIDGQSIIVTVPDVLAVSPADRLARKINISFEARLSGAIHIIGIKGTVSV